MKKIILSLIFFSIFTWPCFAEPIFKDANELQIYMRQNFYYHLDPVIADYSEYVQLPTILEYSKFGDCEDFSLFSFYHLKKMGYKTVPFAIILKDKEEIVGHAITVFQDKDGTYSIFTNQYVLKTNQTGMIEAIKDIYPTWQFIGIWKPIHYGLLTTKDLWQDVIPIAFVDDETRNTYYNEMQKMRLK